VGVEIVPRAIHEKEGRIPLPRADEAPGATAEESFCRRCQRGSSCEEARLDCGAEEGAGSADEGALGEEREVKILGLCLICIHGLDDRANSGLRSCRCLVRRGL